MAEVISAILPNLILKKSLKVRIFNLYKGLAYINPTRTRQSAAPKGSSIIPKTPFSANSAGAPNIVSEPNQVANKAEAERKRGRDRPAKTKSLEFLTNLEDQAPIATVNAK